MYVRARGGGLYRFELAGLDATTPGAALLGNTVVPARTTLMQLLRKYVDLVKASASRRATRRAAAAAGEMTIEFPEPTDPDAQLQYDLIVYADNPGATGFRDWSTAYAAARATTGTSIVTAQVTGPDALIAALAVRPKGSCIKHLGFKVHGNTDGFLLGSSVIANWVGGGTGMMAAGDFGRKLRPHLCPGAELQVASCLLVMTSGGQSRLSALANAAGAVAEGSTQLVFSRVDAPLPRMWTHGNTMRAVPGKAIATVKSGLHDIIMIP